MKIEALCSIGSGRYDVGDVFDLSKEEAQTLIDKGLAKPSKEKPTPEREKPVIVDMKASREGQEAKKAKAKATVDKREKKAKAKGGK